MRELTSIVAVNRQGVIGAGNALPWRIKSDLAFFKSETINNIVIMGRKTFDSLNRRPLPGRFNVVVTHSFSLFASSETCVAATGIAEALDAAERAPRRFGKVFVIGGQSMYEQFSRLVDRYLITVVDKSVPNGDTFFAENLIGDLREWKQKPLKLGKANNAGDEADFDICELKRLDRNLSTVARSELVGSTRSKSVRNKSSSYKKVDGNNDIQRALIV